MEIEGIKLGQRVNYVRVVVNPENGHSQNVEGEGIVAGFFLGLDRRVQVRVIDDKNQINIDLPAINATDAGKKRYFEHVAAIQKRADDINADVKALVAKGNAEIEAMNEAYLGAAVEVDNGEANDNKKAS